MISIPQRTSRITGTFYFTLLFLLGSFIYSTAQKINYSYSIPEESPLIYRNSLSITLEDLPTLSGLGGINPTTPRYSVLWIFSDGQFRNFDTLTVKHLYPSATPGLANSEVLAYATALYSGQGDPPPKAFSPIPISGTPIKITEEPVDTIYRTTKGAEEESYLRLQKNHFNLVPDDTTVWILSIRNELEVPIRGEVYLFYNGPIEIFNLDQLSDVIEAVKTKESSVPAFAENKYQETLLFNSPEIEGITYQLDTTGVILPGNFTKALIFKYDTLPGQSERHIFLPFHNDPLLLDKVPPQKVGFTKYLAVVTGQPLTPSFPAPSLTDSLGLIANQYKVPSFLENVQSWSGSVFFEDDGDPINAQFSPSSFNIISLDERDNKLAKAHDPNEMKLAGCACPADPATSQELLCSIEFVNEGTASTRDVYIGLKLPPQIESVSPAMVDYHPKVASVDPSTFVMDESQPDSITWELPNLKIDPLVEFGEGHPATYGRIVFAMKVKPGVSLEDIPAMSACIRFDQKTATPVCTDPASPTPLTLEDVVSVQLEEYLSCQECPKPLFDLPWWLLLLILLLVLIIVGWVLYQELM